VGGFRAESQNLAFRGPRGPGASKAQPPGGLVGHCTSGRPLNPPLLNDVGVGTIQSINHLFVHKKQHKMTMYNWRTGHASLSKSS